MGLKYPWDDLGELSDAELVERFNEAWRIHDAVSKEIGARSKFRRFLEKIIDLILIVVVLLLAFTIEYIPPSLMKETPRSRERRVLWEIQEIMDEMKWRVKRNKRLARGQTPVSQPFRETGV